MFPAGAIIFPGAADHAGNLRSAHALTGSMFFLLVEIVKSMFLDHFGAQESEGVPDSESAREMLSRASLIFGFGWFPDHFGFGVNSPVSRTLYLSQEKFLAPIVLHYWSELEPIHMSGSCAGGRSQSGPSVDFCGDSVGRTVGLAGRCAP